MEDNKFRDEILDAVYVISRLNKSQMSWDEHLKVKLKERMAYIDRKLEIYTGYSKAEKEARKDEIRGVLDIIKDTLEVLNAVEN